MTKCGAPPQKKKKKLILQQREHNDRMGTMSKKEGICSHSMDVWVNACGFPPVQPPPLCDEVPLPGLSPLDWPLSIFLHSALPNPVSKWGQEKSVCMCLYLLLYDYQNLHSTSKVRPFLENEDILAGPQL